MVAEVQKGLQQFGAKTIFLFSVAISAGVGLFNLLPLPALDGGRILLLLIEGIRRKPLPRNIEAGIHAVGMLVLLAVSVVLVFFDVFRLI